MAFFFSFSRSQTPHGQYNRYNSSSLWRRQVSPIILEKINGKPLPLPLLLPLPPKSKMEKWPVFALGLASSLIWLGGGGGGWGLWEFAVPFYSVQNCSLGCTVLNYNYLQAHFSKVPVITEPGMLFCLHLRSFFY